MKPKPHAVTPTALRRRAEAALREKPPEVGPAWSEPDTQRLLHELMVHQIELEMQNAELQEARDALEVEREKYSDLYDFAPVGYLTLDREGTVGESNLAGAHLLGVERSRLVGRRFGFFVAAASRAAFNTFFQQVFESLTKESCELVLQREGQPPVDVRLEAVAAAAGRECRLVLRDITDLRRMEADHLLLGKLESTGILAGGIAHDFNNLLTVILMNLELGLMQVSANPELTLRLEEAKQATLQANNLTQQFLTFAGGGVTIRKVADLSRLIQESVGLALSGGPVRCEFELPADLWLAEVDPGQIGRVFANLVQNAREAMPGGGTITVRAGNVVLDGHAELPLLPGDYIQVSLTDTGPGIAPELLPKIFDPYFSTKQRGVQKGMGLGLTICHNILLKHGGAISVAAPAGAGATFQLYLPAVRQRPGPVPVPPPKLLSWHGRILVMDDEEGVRLALGGMLRRMGHEVELLADGATVAEIYAKARAQGRPFAAVLLDLTVRGGMGGLEAVRALLELDPGVNAIVMSGYARDPVLVEHKRHGFKGALSKPFEQSELAALLAQLQKSERPTG